MKTRRFSFAYEGHPLTWTAPAGDHITRWMIRTGTFYELPLLEELRRRLRTRAATGRPARAIDVGAFIGTHSVYLRRFCAITELVAFEPNPQIAALLSINLKANGAGGRLLRLAVGATEGECGLEVRDAKNLGMTRVVPGAGVALVKLDSFAFDDVSLIKIDVEGAELEVLAGAAKTIERSSPILAVEAQDLDAQEALARTLAPIGYQLVGHPDGYGATPVFLFER